MKVLEKLQIVHKKGDIFSSPPQEPLAHCVSTDCAYGGVEKVKQQNKQKNLMNVQ